MILVRAETLYLLFSLSAHHTKTRWGCYWCQRQVETYQDHVSLLSSYSRDINITIILVFATEHVTLMMVCSCGVLLLCTTMKYSNVTVSLCSNGRFYSMQCCCWLLSKYIKYWMCCFVLFLMFCCSDGIKNTTVYYFALTKETCSQLESPLCI